MRGNIDLLHGPIFPSLTKLALPIMATSFVQMAYNMTDMIWIGRIGSGAVAAVGASGMYMWLANGIATMPKMGGQVKTGYSIGADDSEGAASYAKSAIQIAIFAGILYGIIALLFSGPLIGFFNLHSGEIIGQAEIYLKITCGLVVFSFTNQVLTGITTAMGNSRISFLATTAGLIINIVLDPVLIFGVGPFPRMGVTGAAIATVIAQMIVTGVFAVYAMHETTLFSHIHLLKRPEASHIAEIVKIGFPTSIQSMTFTGISMILTRLVTNFGDAAIAIQRVGSQIEGISWVTAEGFGAAVNSFLAQNLGARSRKRIVSGYRVSLTVTFFWGLMCTLVLILFPEPIFRLFIPEAELLPMGVSYLKILGLSQLFMCVELTTAGAFAGLGRTVPPSIVSIVFTAARIPLAFLLADTVLGLNGVWWSVSISSIVKGFLICIWFLYFLKKQLHISTDEEI
ncbi:MATE family efflux transporter [Bariatricus massiliensis]|uniref:Probable multidrug resistance protein NorM n=1 Tax=Bariatricus massiliensis TaxID=1745713 RepID=A0ABS8DIU6_9FIRM|nr:MATE family efflux transporter [Bariatricus massiliensis]MCB7304638.1 MATE family efflux transporter [Bariatricus massiliensis]MCB7374789.1 MATE family efflux transporter [Bariatricus massiliensis]MCB7388084.1 MATE family efflux transporter [Bariatricus massiliensis]MCB7411954.1 MATE family efflux transporter [Bariatricus massiliensis]MCQ5254255.1 MATE family efflux transporter [Bariatricus massiliensis]